MNFNRENSIHTFILYGFGSTRYKTPLQGTVGSLAATIFAAVLSLFVGSFWFWLGLSAILTWVGFRSLQIYKRGNNISGEFDPSWITIDEWCGIFAGCCTISLVFGKLDLSYQILNFVLFRYFDMAKPFAIFCSQGWGENFGVFADDLLAGIMSGVVVLIIHQI